MNSPENCFTFPPEADFLREIAAFVLRSYTPEQYTKILILLPNRRSCVSLREAFLNCSEGKALLLPRIAPIGEVEDELFFAEFADDGRQAIDPVRRHFLLMKLIAAFFQARSGAVQLSLAAEPARALASFLDEVEREGLNFESLEKLAPEELAAHWQKTLDFLTILSRKWPEVLKEENVADIVALRNSKTAQLAEAWRKKSPDYPVIAAGSTGSVPATAELLKVIASLEKGTVILPALDKNMSEEDRKEIGETHPQFALKNLLKRMEITPDDVAYLGDGSNPSGVLHSTLRTRLAARQGFIRAIFSPPAVTAGWREVVLPGEDAWQGVEILEADTQFDEARAIAISLREVLETPGKTAALVTSDRGLARAVCVALKRFGIAIDDSAGKSLSVSAPAGFLRLVASVVSGRFAPVELLALLRHPLAAAGLCAAECRSLSRELEAKLLRGVRREGGIGGLVKAAKPDKTVSDELIALLVNIEEKSAGFAELFVCKTPVEFSKLLAEHIKFSEFTAGDNSCSGAELLWKGEAGNALAELIASWSVNADILPALDAVSYPALFDALLAPEVYRTSGNLHPRLHILSPMEARLQRYDKVILGGLNEGVWPPSSDGDPWMSRPQRAAFGLPPLERRIGQSAHDFVMQLYSPEVLLTRARKIEGTPTLASRFWVRMQVLLQARLPHIFTQMNTGKYFAACEDFLEKPEEMAAVAPPAPSPDVSFRPRSLSVTAVDMLLRNPYNVYARYILDLYKLEAVDREPNASDFGNVVHKALEIFAQKYPDKIAADVDIKSELLAAGKIAFAAFADRPAVACLWNPRFAAICEWLAGEEKLRRGFIEKIYAEVRGRFVFSVDDKEFTLTTYIDRLEKMPDGKYSLIDYKTGTVPKESEIKKGLVNQLPLEALIVQNGEVLQQDKIKIPQGNVAPAQYWKLSGKEGNCEIVDVEIDPQEVFSRLVELIRKFDNPAQAYFAQTDSSLIKYDDYGHLSRRKEWGAG